VLERDELPQIALLLKYGITGEGRMLAQIGKKLEIRPEQTGLVRFPEGKLEGPQTILKETERNGN